MLGWCTLSGEGRALATQSMPRGARVIVSLGAQVGRFCCRHHPGAVEQGTPLYRAGKRACPLLELLPNVLGFPQLDGTPSPASHFVAHYDAAGGARPYGMHGPWHTGSKLSAIAAAVRQRMLVRARVRVRMLVRTRVRARARARARARVGVRVRVRMLVRVRVRA